MQLPRLTEDQLTRIVQEAALEYYETPEIADQLGLDRAYVARLLNTPEVKSQVLILKRELTESGERFRMKAQSIAHRMVTELAALAIDSTQNASDRIKAAELVVRFSGHAPRENAPAVSVTLNLGEALRDAQARVAPLIDLTPDFSDG